MDENGIPMTCRIGSIGDFVRWTKRIVADPAVAAAAPGQWFADAALADAMRHAKGRPKKLIGPV